MTVILLDNIFGKRNMGKIAQTNKVQNKKWYEQGYADGMEFVRNEADYEDLAAIARAKGIPVNWDIFRAEILNKYLNKPLFDFQAYSEGFSQVCIKFFESI